MGGSSLLRQGDRKLEKLFLPIIKELHFMIKNKHPEI